MYIIMLLSYKLLLLLSIESFIISIILLYYRGPYALLPRLPPLAGLEGPDTLCMCFPLYKLFPIIMEFLV